MTKNEMKNRISMALKDPILQQGFECICKNLSDLEREISVLLSCKNCPENKGGYICQKEYEGKCLSQKIQYIKELQEENEVLRDDLQETKRLLERWIDDRPYTVSEQKDLIADTEQFLGELKC